MDGEAVCSAYFLIRLLLGGLDLTSDLVVIIVNTITNNPVNVTTATILTTIVIVIINAVVSTTIVHHHLPPTHLQVLASLLLVSGQPGWAGAVFAWILAGVLVAVIAVVAGR